MFSALDVSVNVAYAHHDNNRNVFGEWVFCYQGAYPFLQTQEKQVGDFCVPSPVSSLRAEIVTLFIQFYYFYRYQIFILLF